MYFESVVLEPFTTDVYGDKVSPEHIVNLYNQFDGNLVLTHESETPLFGYTIIKNEILEKDSLLVSGKLATKGSWIMGIDLQNDQIIHEMINGIYNGFSISAKVDPDSTFYCPLEDMFKCNTPNGLTYDHLAIVEYPANGIFFNKPDLNSPVIQKGVMNNMKTSDQIKILENQLAELKKKEKAETKTQFTSEDRSILDKLKDVFSPHEPQPEVQQSVQQPVQQEIPVQPTQQVSTQPQTQPVQQEIPVQQEAPIPQEIPSQNQTQEPVSEVPIQQEIPAQSMQQISVQSTQQIPIQQEIPIQSQTQPVQQEIPMQSQTQPVQQEIPMQSQTQPVQQEIPIQSQTQPVQQEVSTQPQTQPQTTQDQRVDQILTANPSVQPTQPVQPVQHIPTQTAPIDESAAATPFRTMELYTAMGRDPLTGEKLSRG